MGLFWWPRDGQEGNTIIFSVCMVVVHLEGGGVEEMLKPCKPQVVHKSPSPHQLTQSWHVILSTPEYRRQVAAAVGCIRSLVPLYGGLCVLEAVLTQSLGSCLSM